MLLKLSFFDLGTVASARVVRCELGGMGDEPLAEAADGLRAWRFDSASSQGVDDRPVLEPAALSSIGLPDRNAESLVDSFCFDCCEESRDASSSIVEIDPLDIVGMKDCRFLAAGLSGADRFLDRAALNEGIMDVLAARGPATGSMSTILSMGCGLSHSGDISSSSGTNLLSS